MKPKVYVNSINKNIKNNKEVYHFDGINDEVDIIDVSEGSVLGKINEIFNSDSFVFKCRVNILLKDRSELIEDVIALKDGNLITLSDKKIKVDDIVDIKKAN